MSAILVQILIILLLILLNGFFAMAEMALISARAARLEPLAEDGDKAACTVLELAKNPKRMLSTVQVGITLIGILNGAFGGVTLGDEVAGLLARVPWLERYSVELGLLLVVVPITYLSLVVGELIPKQVALQEPEKLARFTARPMKALAWLMRPVISLLNGSTTLGMKLLGLSSSNRPTMTEDELKSVIEEGTRSGVLEESEQDIVEGVLRFGGRTVDAIMTARIDITWLDLNDPFEVNLKKVRENPRNLFPACIDNLDEVQGILLAKDVLAVALEKERPDLQILVQPVLYAPESMAALRLLEEFKRTGHRAALVLDEFGGVLGMVTPTDVLESIVGDFSETEGEEETSVIQRADGTWLMDGLLRVDELKEILDVDSLPDEERVGYQTLGGMVMSCLGSIPVSGQSFEWKDLRFEVVDMDGKRVDKVLVTSNRKETEDGGNDLQGGNGIS
jgi:putative hemolysin